MARRSSRSGQRFCLSVVFLPISILTVLLSEEIVTIVYARGAFDAESVRICAQALRGYALMFVPLVFREVYSRFQYGHQDSKLPLDTRASACHKSSVKVLRFARVTAFWA